ncbi:FAD-dependent oxidoreductase, partial [Planctomycetota bacterium]
GFTDTGKKEVIGGLSRDFYHRIWQKYQDPGTWRWQKQSEYGNKGQGTPAIDGKNRTMWIFEPHIAEEVFEDYVRDYQIPVFRDEWLDRSAGVKKRGARIVSISTLSGKTFVGKMFIDATYEGDLLATAGVDYHVGREANLVYGEKLNGVQTGVLHHRHHFGVLKSKISPYVIPGDPTSGVLPRISTSPPGKFGSGDRRVQAYCYRYCATDHPENRIPFPKPDGYDARQYELLLRIYEAGWRETFGKFDPIPNRKTDTNNHGPFSTDNIGMSYDYPEASYERRREILQEHRRYQQGWLYFVANDPRVPSGVQAAMRKWGLAKDEFTDNGNWPHQIYVREARRMIGKFVMTENELTKRKPTPEPVGMGSYSIDSHNVQRYITPEGYVQNEGDIGVGISPYTISYGSLVPKTSQCENLLVSICVSSSHIAFGSIRMEPVFMILGQSAATGAVLALNGDHSVQDVPYSQLREQLLKDGQVLEHASAKTNPSNAMKKYIDPSRLPGIVLDDDAAQLVGNWKTSSASPHFVGHGYRHDGAAKDGNATARYETTLPREGRYEVLISWPPHTNRSSNVSVEIVSAQERTIQTIDQRKAPGIEGQFRSLGDYDFTPDQPAAVIVSNKQSDGYVVIDAVQWRRKSNQSTTNGRANTLK